MLFSSLSAILYLTTIVITPLKYSKIKSCFTLDSHFKHGVLLAGLTVGKFCDEVKLEFDPFQALAYIWNMVVQSE